jgi:phage repressor protein C with HTH and peptisase S24 domain
MKSPRPEPESASVDYPDASGRSDVEFRRRLDAVARLYRSRERAAQAAEKSVDMLTNYVTGKTKPPFVALAKLAAGAGVSLDWIASGKGSMRFEVREESPDYLARPGPGDDYVLVPEPETADPSGPRGSLDLPQVVDYLAFKRAWLRDDVGLQPADLAIVETRGDAMAPTVGHGDLALVDLAQRTLVDGLYLLRRGDELVVRRVNVFWGEGFRITCDNPGYEGLTVRPTDAVKYPIVGRVVWVMRRV